MQPLLNVEILEMRRQREREREKEEVFCYIMQACKGYTTL